MKVNTGISNSINSTVLHKFTTPRLAPVVAVAMTPMDTSIPILDSRPAAYTPSDMLTVPFKSAESNTVYTVNNQKLTVQSLPVKPFESVPSPLECAPVAPSIIGSRNFKALYVTDVSIPLSI